MNQPKVVLALRLMKMLQNNKTLTIDEIKQIADALGVKFEQSFTLPDGEQYKIEN